MAGLVECKVTGRAHEPKSTIVQYVIRFRGLICMLHELNIQLAFENTGYYVHLKLHDMSLALLAHVLCLTGCVIVVKSCDKLGLLDVICGHVTVMLPRKRVT